VEAIACRALTKRYGPVVAVDNLDLSVEKGSVFGFLGPNGAGKTTTVRLLVGLSRATAGQAFVTGEPVHINSVVLRSRIGYLPEEPSFYNWMSGRDFLLYIGELFHLPPNENKRRCDELLEFAGLKDAAKRKIGGYSKGMRQRLGLAQAMMNRPQVLFLDEPCSALDPIGRREVLDTIIKLKLNTTIFMSTHILADVERTCDTVGIIDRGRLVVQESTNKLRERFARPAFEVEVEGDAQPLVARLRSLPWVSGVEESGRDAGVMLRVRTSDVVEAKRGLPRIISESGLVLVRYELISPSLEEVFIQMVGVREKI
jgi:ABC-2 type transport system ATP-binding protein